MADALTCTCGAPVRKRRRRGGLPVRWCSDACRVRHQRKLSPRTARRCSCGADLSDAWPTRKWCSPQCGQRVRRAKPIEEHECRGCGARFSRSPTKGQRPKWCDDCRRQRRHPALIRAAVRQAVYERDGETCRICLEHVEMDAEPLSDWAPTVDHIVPRAHGGSDELGNLRLAHRWCNSVLSDGRRYTDDDLRVSA